MNRRSVNLILVASLLAWSSGLLLGIHLLETGDHHDSQHCEQCLLLLAGCSAVIAPADSPLPSEEVSPGRVIELESALLTRLPHSAFASRAPPNC